MADAPDPVFQTQQDRTNVKRDFQQFLDGEAGEGKYARRIQEMVESRKTRLIIEMSDLRSNQLYRDSFVQRPLDFIPGFQDALGDMVAKYSVDAAKERVAYTLGFEGSFGRHHVTPRGLTSSHVSTMVRVEGIVTKCSLIRPKIIQSVHYCPATNSTMTRQYHDSASLVQELPTPAVYPTKDDEGNLLRTEFGLSHYRDHQTVTIQEMPEKSPAGQLPRAVDIFLDGDLCDKLKPGDRASIVGVYRALPKKQNGSTNGVFKTVIIANNIRQLSKEADLQITEEDVVRVREVAQRPDAFELLAKSLAPSIYGHEYIKKSLLLLLLGGMEKNLKDGTHIRGDINMLMIGDPSTAKSQLLRFAYNTAPLAINTTGRGSSGVGLTAAVTTDPESGDRRLEAGAMVLGDRGVVCIDEFDKMSDADRVAIHEVMEQQTVTIAKAGIHASLNARCSVVAAANPVYGQYNPARRADENIGLPDSLISRFDLLFIVLDKMNPEEDTLIADHVLAMHRHRPAKGVGALDGPQPAEALGVIPEDSEDEEDTETPMWAKPVARRRGHVSMRTQDKLLSVAFVKKFIQVAKMRASRTPPLMSDAAEEYIHTAYGKLRQARTTKTAPITARTLETIIRLSTAHAKVRLSATVTEADAAAAFHVLNYALNNEANSDVMEGSAGIKRQRKSRESGPTQEDPDDPFAFEDETQSPSQPKSKRQATGKSRVVAPTETPEAASDVVMPESQDTTELKKEISRWMRQQSSEASVRALVAHLDRPLAEVRAVLQELADQNRIMLDEDTIILI